LPGPNKATKREETKSQRYDTQLNKKKIFHHQSVFFKTADAHGLKKKNQGSHNPENSQNRRQKINVGQLETHDKLVIHTSKHGQEAIHTEYVVLGIRPRMVQ